MAKPLNIVVCGSLVPDPLQTLEPVQTPQGPGLKNEQMLPSVLDPWAACALYEAAALAKARPGSKVTLVALGPKAKLQQLMMTVAQNAAAIRKSNALPIPRLLLSFFIRILHLQDKVRPAAR